jgi:hypothetical protein
MAATERTTRQRRSACESLKRPRVPVSPGGSLHFPSFPFPPSLFFFEQETSFLPPRDIPQSQPIYPVSRPHITSVASASRPTPSIGLKIGSWYPKRIRMGRGKPHDESLRKLETATHRSITCPYSYCTSLARWSGPDPRSGACRRTSKQADRLKRHLRTQT